MTKAERHHYSKLADLGCIVCLMQGYGHSAAEIHHIRQGAGMGQKSHIHAGAAGFEKLYGTELELLAETIKLIAG